MSDISRQPGGDPEDGQRLNLSLVPDYSQPTDRLGRQQEETRSAGRLHLRPADAATFAAQVHAEAAKAYWFKGRHELRAGRWAFVDTSTRLIVALGAALGAVSALAKNETLTLIFSVATAVVSALNAAASPPDLSTAHRTAARDLLQPVRRLDDLAYVLRSHESEPEYKESSIASEGVAYDGGYWRTEYAMTDELLEDLWATFRAITDQIDEIEQRAPAINQLREYHGRLEDYQKPETFWELVRYRRALKYRTKADKYAWEAQQANHEYLRQRQSAHENRRIGGSAER